MGQLRVERRGPVGGGAPLATYTSTVLRKRGPFFKNFFKKPDGLFSHALKIKLHKPSPLTKIIHCKKVMVLLDPYCRWRILLFLYASTYFGFRSTELMYWPHGLNP